MNAMWRCSSKKNKDGLKIPNRRLKKKKRKKPLRETDNECNTYSIYYTDTFSKAEIFSSNVTLNETNSMSAQFSGGEDLNPEVVIWEVRSRQT